MNESVNSILPSLIRGLYVNAAGKPFAVVSGGALSPSVPKEALSINIEKFNGTDEIDEQALADFFRGQFSVLNADAADGKIKLPSCIAVGLHDNDKALFWVDEDIDGARRRMNEKDASPLLVENLTAKKFHATASARSSVVKNKIALVTGGAQGFGEEIVRGLAGSGALVFIADINLEGAEKLAGIINTEEGRTAAIAVAVNVSDETSVREMFAYVEKTAGGLDLFVSATPECSGPEAFWNRTSRILNLSPT